MMGAQYSQSLVALWMVSALNKLRNKMPEFTGYFGHSFASVPPLALEPRYMFDAAGAATAADSAEQVQADTEAEQASHDTSDTSDTSTHAPGTSDGADTAQAAGVEVSGSEFSVLQAVDPSQNGGRKEVAFVDSSLADWDVLVAGIGAGIEIVLLDGNSDGLRQIATWAAQNDGFDAIHILSHGSEGQVHLGSFILDTDTATTRSNDLAALGAALGVDGDVMLYGCDVAGGSGAALIDALANATGADVAASTDMTGAQSLGGDWQLEHTTGVIETAGLVVTDYQGILDTITIASGSGDGQLDDGDGTFVKVVSGRNLTFTGPDGYFYNNNLGTGYLTSDDSAKVNATKLTISMEDGYSFDLTSFEYYTGNADTVTVSVTYADGSTGSGTFTATTDSASTVSDFSTLAGLSTVSLNDIKSVVISSTNSVGSYDFGTNNFVVSDVKAIVSNSAPTVTGAPASATVTEDVATAIDLSGVTVADAEGDTITLTLAAAAGTLASVDGNVTTGGVTIANSGTSSMTLSGTVSDLNTYLNATNITYQTASNDTVARNITITPNDGTVNGTAVTVTTSVTAVNDAPTVSGVPTDVTVTEDTASNFDLSAITFTEVDGDNLTVTIAASAGTFAGSTSGSVTVGGSGTGSLTLSGTAANINTWLDTASNIKYTGASNVNGDNVATYTVHANDGTVNPQVGSGNIDITAVNDAPTASGVPTDVTVTEDTASNFDLSAITFADDDGDSLTVTIAASAGTFSASTSGSVTVGGSGTGSLTLSGTAANINTWLDTASNIKYTGASNASGDNAATFTINANDGTANPQVGSGNIDITAVNDTPTVSGVPTDVTVTEDTASNFDLSAITFTEVDGDNLTVTIAASAGTFAGSTSGSVTVGGSGTGSLTLSGTAANINTWLDTASNIKYTGASNVNGDNVATYTVHANDGTVNPQVGSGNIDITAVNDAPTASGVPTDVTVTEDTASNFDLSAITFADDDGDSLTVTIAASAGTFSASTSGSVTVGGSGTGSLTLSGTAANINTWLDTASNIKYTGASNASGDNAATFTINANDGTANPQVGSGNIDITAVNDTPTVSGVPTDVTVTEDTASNFDLSAITFTEVDGDNLTVTIAASAGTFAGSTSGSVTVGGSGTGSLTLSGTAANINTWLDTASNIKYTGASNVNGDNVATFTIHANDGTVNPQVGGGNIDIAAVNDAPVVGGVFGDTSSSIVAGSGAQNVSGLDDATVSNVDATDYNGGSLVIGQNTGTFNGSWGVDGTTVTSGGDVTVSAGEQLSVGGVNIGTIHATNDGQGGNVLQIDFNANADSARVQTLIRALTYLAPSGLDSRSFTLTLNDADGTANSGDEDASGSFTVNVTPNPPVIGNLSGDSVSAANNAVVSIDQNGDMTLTDADSPNFNGGNLTITRTGGLSGNFLLNSATATSGSDGVIAAGETISVGGTAIGTVTTDGQGSNNLVITLNTSASPANIQILIRALQYQSTASGSHTFSATVADAAGGSNPATSTAATFAVAVEASPVNTVPGAQSTVDGTAKAITGISVADSDSTNVTTTISVPSGNGTFSASGAATISGLGTNSIQISGTSASVNATLANLTYTPAVNASGAQTITVLTSDGTNSDTDTISVAVQDRPTVGGLSGDSVNYTAGQTVKLDVGQNVVISDADSSHFNSGNLTVSITAGGVGSEDILTIETSGTTITLSGTTATSTVSVGGVVIGTLVNNIAAGNNLVINFNSNSTPERVQTLMKAVAYRNAAGTPTFTNRTVSFNVSDGNSNSSGANTVTVVLAQPATQTPTQPPPSPTVTTPAPPVTVPPILQVPGSSGGDTGTPISSALNTASNSNGSSGPIIAGGVIQTTVTGQLGNTSPIGNSGTPVSAGLTASQFGSGGGIGSNVTSVASSFYGAAGTVLRSNISGGVSFGDLLGTGGASGASSGGGVGGEPGDGDAGSNDSLFGAPSSDGGSDGEDTPSDGGTDDIQAMNDSAAEVEQTENLEDFSVQLAAFGDVAEMETMLLDQVLSTYRIPV